MFSFGLKQWVGKTSACNCYSDVSLLFIASPLHLEEEWGVAWVGL